MVLNLAYTEYRLRTKECTGIIILRSTYKKKMLPIERMGCVEE